MLGVEGVGSIPGRGKVFYSSPKPPTPALEPVSLLFDRSLTSLPGRKAGET